MEPKEFVRLVGAKATVDRSNPSTCRNFVRMVTNLLLIEAMDNLDGVWTNTALHTGIDSVYRTRFANPGEDLAFEVSALLQRVKALVHSYDGALPWYGNLIRAENCKPEVRGSGYMKYYYNGRDIGDAMVGVLVAVVLGYYKIDYSGRVLNRFAIQLPQEYNDKKNALQMRAAVTKANHVVRPGYKTAFKSDLEHYAKKLMSDLGFDGPLIYSNPRGNLDARITLLNEITEETDRWLEFRNTRLMEGISDEDKAAMRGHGYDDVFIPVLNFIEKNPVEAMLVWQPNAHRGTPLARFPEYLYKILNKD